MRHLLTEVRKLVNHKAKYLCGSSALRRSKQSMLHSTYIATGIICFLEYLSLDLLVVVSGLLRNGDLPGIGVPVTDCPAKGSSQCLLYLFKKIKISLFLQLLHIWLFFALNGGVQFK